MQAKPSMLILKTEKEGRRFTAAYLMRRAGCHDSQKCHCPRKERMIRFRFAFGGHSLEQRT